MPVDTFDMEPSTATAQEAVQGRQQPSQTAQFAAVLKKNFILQTRSRKAFFGIGGWAALLIEMFIPGLFFLLMCIPKYYIPLSPSPRQLSAAYSLDSNSWARPYHGMHCNHCFCTCSHIYVCHLAAGKKFCDSIMHLQVLLRAIIGQHPYFLLQTQQQ